MTRRWGPGRTGFLLGLHPSTVYRVLSRYSIPADLARRTADVMVETDPSGVESHGIAMLPWYAALLCTGEVHATARSHVLRETAVSAVVDAALDQIKSYADGGLTPSAGPRRWQTTRATSWPCIDGGRTGWTSG